MVISPCRVVAAPKTPVSCRDGFDPEAQQSVSDRYKCPGTGARRGILGLPGVREEVGVVGIHHGGHFYEFVPVTGSLRWDVSPWGRYGPSESLPAADVRW